MNTLAFVEDTNYPSGKIGWLCVRNAESYGDKPETVVNYWPASHGHIKDFQEMFPELGTDAQLHGDYRGYSFYRGSMNYSPVVRLTDGGQTKSVKFEVIPIPCPKVRKGIETRFRNGYWQKYLKADGWVAA